MKTNVEKSILAFINSGVDCLNRKSFDPSDEKIDCVFYSAMDKATKKEYLVSAKKHELSLFQRVLFFFGIGSFSLRRVNQLANEILTNSVFVKKFDEMKTKPDIFLEGLVKGLLAFNEKISKSKNNLEKSTLKKWIFGRQDFSEKVDKNITLISQMTVFPLPVAPSSVSGKPLNPSGLQVSDVASSSQSTKVDLPGRGINNPGAFLCYFNSAIQALWASPGMREVLWKDEKNDIGRLIECLSILGTAVKDKNMGSLKAEDWEIIFKYCPQLKNKFEFFSTKKAPVGWISQLESPQGKTKKLIDEIKSLKLPDQADEIAKKLYEYSRDLKKGFLDVKPEGRQEWLENTIQELELMDGFFNRLKAYINREDKRVSLNPEEWKLFYKYQPGLRSIFEYFSEDTPQGMINLVQAESEKVKGQQGVRKWIMEVFKELDKGGECLKHSEDPMKSLIKSMAPLFKDEKKDVPALSVQGKQRDQNEVLMHLLPALLPPEKKEGVQFFVTIHGVWSIGDVEGKKKALQESSRSMVNKISLQDAKKDPNELLQMILLAAEIPALESRKDSPQYPVMVNASETRWLQQCFSGETSVEIDVDVIENQDWFPSSWKGNFDWGLLGAKDKKLQIHTFEKRCLMGEPPKSLPIYVKRFTNEGDKDPSPVGPPYTLDVPLEGERKASYKLRAVTCHSGGDSSSGHYYTYVAHETKDGKALWSCHSDRDIGGQVPWRDIEEEVEENATFYVYDKID